MKTFNVVKKADNKLVYSYTSEVPAEWENYPFADFDHVEYTAIEELIPVKIEPIKITRLAFRNRFKSEEKVALELASKDNLTASLGERKLAAMIKVYLDDINSASFIDLSRKDTRVGVHMLEQYGLIGVGRAIVILDTQPTEEEIFNG